MKDITSTSFGLAVAYLLPGLAGFYSLSFWFPIVRGVFERFSGSQIPFGFVMLVILVSLIVGLQLSAFRFFIFEFWLKRKFGPEASVFANLTEDRSNGVRLAIDEAYRYHQFWGGMAIVQLALPFGYARQSAPTTPCGWVGFLVCLVVLEAITISAAISAFIRYAKRLKAILK